MAIAEHTDPGPANPLTSLCPLPHHSSAAEIVPLKWPYTERMPALDLAPAVPLPGTPFLQNVT